MTVNPHAINARRMIRLQGNDMTYTQVTPSAYNIETSTAGNTEVQYTIRAFKQHYQANQYNSPNLIGKTAAAFWLYALDLAFAPQVNDRITFASEVFTIDSLQEHHARGQLVLYRLIATKG